MKEQIKKVEDKYIRSDIAAFDIGDTIDVHFRIKEENKTRIQVFSGIVIARAKGGSRETFTVRRISYGEGVERTFPANSPLIEKVEVKKKGRVRRAKLYYLRGQKGKKATKVREKVGHKEQGE